MYQLILPIVVLLSIASSLHAQIYQERAGYFSIDLTEPSITTDGEFDFGVLLGDGEGLQSLQLVGSQSDDIQKVVSEIATANSEAAKRKSELEALGLGPMEMFAIQNEFDEAIRSNRMLMTTKVKAILTPQQFSKLTTVALERTIRKSTADGLFAENSGLLKALNMTDAENAQVSKKVKEVQKKLREDINALKKEAAFEIIRSLPKDKQQLFRKQFGVEDN